MNRHAQAVIMLLFGGAVLRASLTDMYLRYVKEGLRPFLIATGLLLVVAGVMTLWYEARRAKPAVEHGHHHEPRVGWLLLLPVLGLILVAPPALGSYAANQAGTVLTAQAADAAFPPLRTRDPVRLSLYDYASRAIYDEGRTLTGRTVRLTGFVTPGPDGQPMLARIVMSCCAADGRPIKVGLIGDVPAGVAADTWLQVDGTYATRRGTDAINRAPVPYLTVTSWQEVTAPTPQYE